MALFLQWLTSSLLFSQQWNPQVITANKHKWPGGFSDNKMLWCSKQLFVSRIITYLLLLLLFWRRLSVGSVPRPLEARRTHTLLLLQDTLCVVLCGAAVHFHVSCLLFVQGRPGRQGFPGLTGPDGLKVRPTSHTSAAKPLTSITEHSLPGSPSMIKHHLNMCKLDVNPPLPQGNRPPSTFPLIWTKNERHE